MLTCNSDLPILLYSASRKSSSYQMKSLAYLMKAEGSDHTRLIYFNELGLIVKNIRNSGSRMPVVN